MEDAWNAGDGERFAKPFALDGDQVNVIGEVLRGREDIAARHDQIFTTVYRGSRIKLELIQLTYVTGDVVLTRVQSALDVPHGPRQGRIATLMTVLFRKTHGRWEIVTLHKTQIAKPKPQ